jgi:hypothetical protein
MKTSSCLQVAAMIRANARRKNPLAVPPPFSPKHDTVRRSSDRTVSTYEHRSEPASRRIDSLCLWLDTRQSWKSSHNNRFELNHQSSSSARRHFHRPVPLSERKFKRSRAKSFITNHQQESYPHASSRDRNHDRVSVDLVRVKYVIPFS